ncbi:TetR/AcrR family transcriptional regulator [Ekhidna sp.]
MDKKAKIIKAAFSLLSKNGILDTSVDDIAKLAGVSKKTLYFQFGSKDRLIKETFSWKMMNVSKAVDEVIEMDLFITKKIALYIKVICDSISDISFKVFFDLVNLKTLATPASAEYLKHAVFIRFNKLLDEAKSNEITKPGIEVGKALMTYWTILSPYLLMDLKNDVPYEIKKAESLSKVLYTQLVNFYDDLLTDSNYTKLLEYLSQS